MMNFESGTITMQRQSFKPGTWIYEDIKKGLDCASTKR